MTHEIRVRFENGTATLTIDGKAISIDSNIALLIDMALRTFVREWLAPEEDNTDVYTSPTSNLKIAVRNNDNDNEVVFVIEE
jgi:hypothetical protein